MAETDTPAAPWAAALAGMRQLSEGAARAGTPAGGWPAIPGFTDPATLARAEAFWRDGLALWQGLLDPATLPPLPKDKRFAGEGWQQPAFDFLRRGHQLVGEHLLASVDSLAVDEGERERLRFVARRVAGRAQPVQLPVHQPGRDRAHAGVERGKPRGGAQQPARGPVEGADDARRAGRVRGRAQPRHRAGTGDPPHPAVRADPVLADDRHGAGDPAGHLPAVDQPVLHPRPDPGEELHSLGDRPGHHRVHGVVAARQMQAWPR